MGPARGTVQLNILTTTGLTKAEFVIYYFMQKGVVPCTSNITAVFRLAVQPISVTRLLTAENCRKSFFHFWQEFM